MSNPSPATVAAAAPVRGSIELADLDRATSRTRHQRHDSGYGETTFDMPDTSTTPKRDFSPVQPSHRVSIENPFTSSKDAFPPSYPPTRSPATGDLAQTPHTGHTGTAIPATELEQSTHDLSNPLFQQSLLPVDGGRDAWLFLVGATVIEILVYGFSFSIGILHLYWTSMFGEENSSTVTLASTLQAGMLYMLLGIVGP